MAHDLPVSISDALATMAEPWQQQDLILSPDAAVRMAQFHGEWPFHVHEGDEIFLCWQGTFTIEMDGREAAVLQAGDLYAVPAGCGTARSRRNRPTC